MNKRFIFPLFITISITFIVNCVSASAQYSWIEDYNPAEAIARRVVLPDRYERVPSDSGGFGNWLRNLPLRRFRSTVYLYDGRPKGNQSVHAAVIDIDTGTSNLQQCADAVIRLRAEYLFSREEFDRIHFNFTSGETASCPMWRKGYRPRVTGNTVRWEKAADPDYSYQSFREYLRTVFIYAGSYSLQRELIPVEDINNMKIGDIFIQGGFPGHAVIVVDMARNRSTGEKVFLLAQSYMPAQDIHLLRNTSNVELSPWYRLDFGIILRTPEWSFRRADLRRFPDLE